MASMRVVELFAGVGGFRLGLEGWQGKSATSGYARPLRKRGESAYKVVWSNQWEPSTKRQHANEVYTSRWHDTVHTGADICSVSTEDIPQHDMLVGGFPCQDYSVATTLKNSKGLQGKKGVLWWQIERILREKGEAAPAYLMFENVDRLLQSPSGQRGRDFAVMLASLAALGYAVEWRVINAADYGMPQRRRRIFFIGYKRGTALYDAAIRLGEGILEEGVLSEAFPVAAVPATAVREGVLTGDLVQISNTFGNAAQAEQAPSFLEAGVLVGTTYYTARVQPVFEGTRNVLKDVLVPLREVPDAYRIPEEHMASWHYLKGAKRESRTNAAQGYSYTFSEGALAFPDPLDRPSRTVITGEGGPSPSRTKHVILQDGVFRRLLPVELERLNMFPDHHTSAPEVTDSKRAFFMGNALVVGAIERMGTALLSRISGLPTDQLTDEPRIEPKALLRNRRSDARVRVPRVASVGTEVDS